MNFTWEQRAVRASTRTVFNPSCTGKHRVRRAVLRVPFKHLSLCCLHEGRRRNVADQKARFSIALEAPETFGVRAAPCYRACIVARIYSINQCKAAKHPSYSPRNAQYQQQIQPCLTAGRVPQPSIVRKPPLPLRAAAHRTSMIPCLPPNPPFPATHWQQALHRTWHCSSTPSSGSVPPNANCSPLQKIAYGGVCANTDPPKVSYECGRVLVLSSTYRAGRVSHAGCQLVAGWVALVSRSSATPRKGFLNLSIFFFLLIFPLLILCRWIYSTKEILASLSMVISSAAKFHPSEALHNSPVVVVLPPYYSRASSKRICSQDH